MKPVTSWSDVPIVMDLAFAGRIVAKSPEYLKKLSQKGKFPAVKSGNEWRVTKDALMKHLQIGA